MNPKMNTLFVDDLKSPEDFNLSEFETDVYRTAEEALATIKGLPQSVGIEVLYLDHDLGENIMNGATFLQVLIEDYGKVPTMVVITSMNPVGIQKIRAICDAYNITHFTPLTKG